MSSTIQLGFIPGPTVPLDEAISAYSQTSRYACSDLDESFIGVYSETADLVYNLLHAQNGEVVIMMGEAMLGLWGALSSVLESGDRVVSISNGLYGHGIGEMAESKGATVTMIGDEWNRSLDDKELEQVIQSITDLHPRMVTVVHCDTPSALLMPSTQLARIGAACQQTGALLMADIVSSFGTVDINVEESGIDIAVIGSQKALSCLPDVTIVYVSDRAWSRIEQRKYAGYDALAPWHKYKTRTQPVFPYTISWQAIVALNRVLKQIDTSTYERHAQVAEFTRVQVRQLGLKVYIEDDSDASSSVTAVYIPDGWNWKEFDVALRAKGLMVGGSYGKLEGRVFRLGHMGSQATISLAQQVVDVLKDVLNHHSS